MVSKYDIFYVIAIEGETTPSKIVKSLNKTKKDYRAIFNHVIELNKEGYIEKNGKIKIIHKKKQKKIFDLISFCIKNRINYNLMFKKTMLKFLQKASKKKSFTINDIKIHPKTFKFYVDLLVKYGFLLIISRKPLKCKLLRHHFLIDLSKFFKKDLKFYILKQQTFIKEIKKELRIYKRNLKIHYTVIDNLERKEEIGFIYSSLDLEGNPLTLPQTQKLIVEDVIPQNSKMESVQETMNYKKAVDSMIMNAKDKLMLDLQLILKYHKLAMAHIKSAGVIRKQNVRIKLNPKFKTSDWRLVPMKLNKLMKKYEEFKAKKEDVRKIITFASFFHNEFQRIHPFIDGNSRISRLLLLHILRTNGIPMMGLPLGYFDLYLDLTKRSAKRNDKEFTYLIEEIILMNLKNINRSV